MIMHAQQAQRRGVALVLVLAFLVLISVFVVGFFVSATSELQQSAGYAATVTTQQLSDTATNIVIGQIREATTRPGEVWASQPGMVRTYRTKVPRSFYKLYSASKMVVEGKGGGTGETSATNFRPESDVPVGSESGWNHKPALYVDINDPVRVPLPGSDAGVSGVLGKDYEYRYPVFDPASFYIRDNDDTVGNYPQVAASNPTTAKLIEGAELLKVAGDDSSANPIGSEKKTTYSRMPVRWLYILKDGSITSPARDIRGTVAQWDDLATDRTGIPSAVNPIVGRIAFWTDDETCKVNLNTAGGYSIYKSSMSGKNEDMYAGSYWDSPRFYTIFDRGVVDTSNGNVTLENMSLALAQPIRNEFQRYPGHPATTSLGLLFRNMLTSAQIYALTPRLVSGLTSDSLGNPYSGSDGGSRRLVQAKGKGHEALGIKRDRLYGSVDELLFAAPKATDAMDARRRLNSTEVNASGITPELVNRMRFFLTAHSRAPELNVFGRPRITIWPLWPIYNPAGAATAADYNATVSNGPKTSQATFRKRVNDNATEKLLAFCSTLGPKDNDTAVRPYFFQRSNPYSAVDDGNLKRNVDLFRYLAGLMGQPVYGAGGASTETPDSFADKYPGEKEDGTENAPGAGDYHQLIAEIFDYIRCVNLNDTSHDVPASGTQTVNPGQAGYIGGTSRPEYKYSPHAYVTPTMTLENGKGVPILNNSPGFGRFPTISEAALIFYHSGYMVWDPPQPATPANPNPDNKRRIKYLQNRKEYYDIYAKSGQLPNPTAPSRQLLLTGGTLVYDADGRLVPGERVLGSFMKAFIMFEGFTPMQGYAAESGFKIKEEAQDRGLFFQHEVTGLETFTVQSQNLPAWTKGVPGAGNLNFPYKDHPVNKETKNKFWDSPWGYFGYLGGFEGFFQTLSHGFAEKLDPNQVTPTNGYYYPFQSTAPWKWPTKDGVKTNGIPCDDGIEAFLQPNLSAGNSSPLPGLYIPKADKTFDFMGGNAKVAISFAGTVTTRLELNFPQSDKLRPWPTPTDNIWETKAGGFYHEGAKDQNDGSFTLPPPPAAPVPIPKMPLRVESQFSLAGRILWSRRHASNPWRTDYANDDTEPGTSYPPDGLNYGSRRGQFLQPGDTIRSLIPFNPNSKRAAVNSVGMGDPRTLSLIGTRSSMRGRYFQPHPLYDTSLRHAQGLRTADGDPYIGSLGTGPGGVGSLARDRDPYNKGVSANDRVFTTLFGTMLIDPKTRQPLKYQSGNVAADFPANVRQVFRSDELLPDFDTGLAGMPDGGFCNKSDEGSNSWRTWDSLKKVWYYNLPYYSTNTEGGYDTYFSPNKQMPSPVQFGSLLAGRTKHWQTLCFCPNAIGNPHPGITRDPKDHYILDFFTMPVVEPYAISEPLSTAGKVNLNYAMAPFNHIHRDTAMRAILHPVRVVAVPNADSLLYKQSGGALLTDRNFRFRVDRDETLKAFQSYFNGKTTGAQEIFRTGSQICEMYLYPNMYMTEITSSTGGHAPKAELKDIGIDPPKFAPGDNAMKHFWEQCILTGDNLREKPYNDIYPRITTKSNTYTVHMWVQALKKSSTAGLSKVAAAAAQLNWDEAKDQVVAEYRGSTTIERYIDPEDRRFDPKNTETAAKGDIIDPDKVSLEQLYRFRVIESKRFNP